MRSNSHAIQFTRLERGTHRFQNLHRVCKHPSLTLERPAPLTEAPCPSPAPPLPLGSPDPALLRLHRPPRPPAWGSLPTRATGLGGGAQSCCDRAGLGPREPPPARPTHREKTVTSGPSRLLSLGPLVRQCGGRLWLPSPSGFLLQPGPCPASRSPSRSRWAAALPAGASSPQLLTPLHPHLAPPVSTSFGLIYLLTRPFPKLDRAPLGGRDAQSFPLRA